MRSRAPLIGLALLIGAFAIAAYQITGRHAGAADPDVRTLRIGHWLIHAGMREGFDAVIADYQRLHPDVRIQQNTVPIKTWFAWQRAQWTGGTTPDLMQLGKGTGDIEMGRYYQPLSRWIDEPNPYNVGTPLEGLPWRNTFVEGLTNGISYYAWLGQVFGIPAQVNTTRLFYNVDLLREITGRDEPPRTLDAFLDLLRQAGDHAAHTRRSFVPLALSGPYAEILMNQFFATMTQRLALDLTTNRTLRTDSIFYATGYLEGRWSLETPEVRRTLELWHEIAGHTSPGYPQIPREDAQFTFLAGRALVLFAGSWDYAGIRQESRFPVLVAKVPFPRAGEGRYGEFAHGPPSETEGGMEAVMGVARHSRHPELAVDFLRFLTSYHTARKLIDISHRLSATVDVPVPPDLEPMRPVTDGTVGAHPVNLRWLAGGGAALVFNQNLHLLGGRRDDGVQAFIDAVSARWPAAIRRDVELAPRLRLQNVRITDTRALFTATAGGDEAETAVQVGLLYEAGLDAELSMNQLRGAPPSR